MVVLGFSALDASVLGANIGSLVCTTGSLQTLVQNRPGHQPVIIQTIDPASPKVPPGLIPGFMDVQRLRYPVHYEPSCFFFFFNLNCLYLGRFMNSPWVGFRNKESRV